MSPGDELPSRVLNVEAPAMHVLAEVLRDPNPIHLDPAAAAAAGLGDRVINQGPANLAYIMDMLSEAFPDHRIARFDSRFLANVRGGDEVRAGGVVRSVADGWIECDAWLRLPCGTEAVTASARMEPRAERPRNLERQSRAETRAHDGAQVATSAPSDLNDLD